MWLHNSLAVASLCLPGALSNFLSPTYPSPRDLSSRNSHVATGWRNLTTRLDHSLHGRSNSTLSLLQDLTFSIGLFSTHDSGAETLQYHHAAPEILNASHGTNEVDGDSIYRIASVSKLFTVLAGLIELDGEDWERPLSEAFPAFAQSLREHSNSLDPVYNTQWDVITPSALASQMAGIAQYGAPWYTDFLTTHAFNEAFNTSSPVTDPATYALPPVDESDPAIWPPCASIEHSVSGQCAPSDYTEGVASNPPIFLPWTSPSYSNNGLSLLGLAIANLTGKSMEEVYQESIFDPLDMESSYSEVPPSSEESRCVIAGAPDSGWALNNGLSTPSGGLFSTLNDLAKFGVGILNSTLLSPTETRRWMKPVTHTSNLHYSIGAPWEIYRYTDPKTGIITDIYTKLGDSGYYGSISAFLPDFDTGFSVITASSKATRSQQTLFLIQQIVDTILPALTTQAATELENNYAGTYISPTPNFNSSITFTASKHGAPGLVVSAWISNGTNLLPQIPTIMGARDYRLRPALTTPGDAGQIAFRPATSPQHPVRAGDPSRLFTSFYDADDWTSFGQVMYANMYLSEFIFDVDSDGVVSAVSPAAWRVTLEKRD
ncbi:beta-lactamase/transpeptidase-like protein [Aspergillus cavernicola]|uniref:Beta-lactamase/transpeptidase-like protein n=1 Tax=Aspergillus cavernicola TaxID=176166 RepID=A0ABR4HID3_9EURO